MATLAPSATRLSVSEYERPLHNEDLRKSTTTKSQKNRYAEVF